MSNRLEKIERRTRRQVRCEWCNRWTPMSADQWHDLVVTDPKGYARTAAEIVEFSRSVQWACQRAACAVRRLGQPLGELVR